MNKKVILVTGGTGGHIYPALSLADELQEKLGKENVFFIIDRRPLASRVLSENKYLFKPIIAEPFPRKKIWHICRFIMKNCLGFFQAFFLMIGSRPKVLIAFGAYFSASPVLAAKFLGIPVLLHEQNAFPGVANKVLSKFASRIAISFNEARVYFPVSRTVLVGNPVRKDLLEVSRDEALNYFGISEGKVSILVFGGSLASESINKSIIEMLPYLEENTSKLHFIHAAGAEYSSLLKREYASRAFKASVFNYLDRMDLAYAVADIVIARAGATTVAELSALKKPSILIPFAGATSDHQALNARSLEQVGGAITIIEEDLSGEKLFLKLRPLINSPEKRKKMEQALEPLSKVFIDASTQLSEFVMRYIDV